MGMINAHDIECQGGEIEGKFDFTDTLQWLQKKTKTGNVGNAESVGRLMKWGFA